MFQGLGHGQLFITKQASLGNYTVNLKFCSLIIPEDKHISCSFSLHTPSPHTQSKFFLSLGGPKSTHYLKTFHYPLDPLTYTQAIPRLGKHACSVASAVSLCNPMGCSPPGSSVHGISQARILERVAMPSSRASS